MGYLHTAKASALIEQLEKENAELREHVDDLWDDLKIYREAAETFKEALDELTQHIQATEGE